MYLLQDVFPGEFHLKRAATHEILHGKWRYLHDIAYVQTVYPLLLVQVAQQVLHVHLSAHSLLLEIGRSLFHCHATLEFLDDGEDLDGGLLEQGETRVVDDADLLEGLALEQLVGVGGGHARHVRDQEVGELDAVYRVDHGFSVLVHLREQSTDLHVCFALVLQHLKSESRDVGVLKVQLDIGLS